MFRIDGERRRASSGWPGLLLIAWVAAFLLCQMVLASSSTNSLPFDTFDDNPDDAAIRRTDLGADGPVDENAHALIDLQQVKLGFWLPTDPQADPFAGDFNTNGLFLRMDVSVAGVVNPPGKTQPGQFAPFAYGPNPVYGFIEVEMDRDWDTGGELANPEHRFLGNVVRFGGVPSANQFIDRPALSGAAFDGNFLTLPYVERSGEEFHLALLGSLFTASDITEMAGDGDMIFEADETWRIDAPWFHRAHGYEPFSLALGGTFAGEYMPSCTLQFAHDSVAGMTLISLVFPLTNEAAGLMVGAPPEPLNGNPSDQASILEALTDLRDSAIFLSVFPTGLPEEAIISGWLTKDPTRFTEPPRWDVTALVGTSYTAQLPEGEYFVWTDVFPDVVRGDMNANSKTDDDDRQMMQLYVASQDAADGLLDGRVVLPNFSLNFSVFDLDHSGVVDSVDMTLISELGDQDGDDDVDLCDWARVQNCFSGDGVPIDPSQCGTADLDADSDVDLLDSRRIEAVISGPSSS